MLTAPSLPRLQACTKIHPAKQLRSLAPHAVCAAATWVPQQLNGVLSYQGAPDLALTNFPM